MVMEAMRLSLIEHEAQQRRQKEEEEKKQREEAAAGPPSDTSVPAASAEGSIDAVAPLADLAVSSETTPRSPSPALPPQPSEETVSPPRSRTSTSSQSSPSLLSPARASTDGGRRSGRSTPTSPYGTIGTALLGAASTASAVTTPSPDREPSDPITEMVSLEPQSEPAAAAPAEEPRAPTPVVADATPTIAEPATEPTGDRPSLAGTEHPPSFASSVAVPSTYDVLPSSPESTGSDKPLLDSVVPPTPADDGETSAAAAS